MEYCVDPEFAAALAKLGIRSVPDPFWKGLADLVTFVRVIPVSVGRTQRPCVSGWQFDLEGKNRSRAARRVGTLIEYFGDPNPFVVLPNGEKRKCPCYWLDGRQEMGFERVEIRKAVGVPTGQPIRVGGFVRRYLCVLDIDAERGGLHDLHALVDEKGMPPPTAIALTKTEGCMHLWFVTDRPIASRRTFRPGIELKACGSYVLAPPTPGYRWYVHPGAAGFARLEDWLDRDEIYSRAPTRRPRASSTPAERPVTRPVTWIEDPGNLDTVCRQLASMPPDSGRNNVLFKAACFTRDLPDSAERLAQAAEAAGLPRSEIDGTIASARRYRNGPTATPRSTTRNRVPCCNELFPKLRRSERRVLEDIVALHGGADAEGYQADIYAVRFAEDRLGLRIGTVSKALCGLVGKGLLRRGKPKQLKLGQRPANTFAPTPKGAAVVRELRDSTCRPGSRGRTSCAPDASPRLARAKHERRPTAPR